MQVNETKITSNKKIKNLSFQANPIQNKVVETVKDEALKIAGVAATAIGAAAIAIAKKEDSINDIRANFGHNNEHPELEVLKPLSSKDAKKIYKKIKISEEDVEKYELESEGMRLFLSIALNIYYNFEKEKEPLEKFLKEVLKEIIENFDEKKDTTIELCNIYKNITTNNIKLIKQLYDTELSENDLVDDEELLKNLPQFYQFLLDYKAINNKNFKNNTLLDFKNLTIPNYEEIERKSKLLQQYPDLASDGIFYFQSLENAENSEFLEKIKAGKAYPNLNENIIYKIAKTDLSIEEAMQIFDSLSKKSQEIPDLDKKYFQDEIQKLCDVINKETLHCALSLIKKAKDYQIRYVSDILKAFTQENIETISIFINDENVSINTCHEIIKTDFKLITKDLVESLIAKGHKTSEIGMLIPKVNEENIDVLEQVLEIEEIGAGNKTSILKEINKDNKALAIEMIQAKRSSYISTWLSLTTKENLETIKIMWDNFKDLIYENQLTNIFKKAHLIDKEFLCKILSDEQLKNKEKYCNEKSDFISSITEVNKDIIKTIYYQFPNFNRLNLKTLAKAINEENVDFVKELLTEENVEKMAKNEYFTSFTKICSLIRNVNKENKHFAKFLLENKPELLVQDGYTGSDQCIAAYLLHSYKGCDDFVIETINNGGLEKYKLIASLDTDCWQTAIERNYFEKNYNIDFIKGYSKSENEDIDILHTELFKDAYAKRDLLKTGLEDLTNYDIDKVFGSLDVIFALDLIGKTNLEAAFPLMIDNFKDFIETITKMKLSPENKALLIKTINPTNTPEYKALKKEINRLKKRLNKLVGEENLYKINELKSQQAEVLKRLEPLKTELKSLHTEFKTNPTPEIEAKIQELKTKIKPLENEAKALGAQAQSIYFKSENATQIKEVMKEIGIKTKQAQTIADSAKMIKPQDVVIKTRVIAGLINECTEEEMSNFIKMIKTSVEDNNKAWNDAINKKVFNKMSMNFDEKLSERLRFSESKYISELFVSSTRFFNNLENLVSIIKEHPELSIEEILDTLPSNQETKRMFEELGVDYQAWTRINKNSHTKVEIELNAEQAKAGAIQSLEEDLNDLQFKTLPDQVKEKIWTALAKIGVTFERSYKDNFVGDGFNAGQEEFWKLYKNGSPIVFDDMPKIVSVIKKTINEDEFWSKQHHDSAIETARGTMYEHLTKLRTADVDNAKALKTDEVHEIEIHKTDMYDIKKALGLGNDAQCCTALGKDFNEWSAPNYIKHKCIGAIELTDNGNFVGNTMMFLAIVDGEVALVLDNIELKTKYQYNDKIRDAFMEYAKKLCAEIGKPDMPIYAGPNRHKLKMAIYPKEIRKMTVIGSTNGERVYMDYTTGGKSVDGKEEESVNLYKIR